MVHAPSHAKKHQDPQAKHTPGPWQQKHSYDTEGRLTIIGNVDGEYVDGRAECTYDTVAVCLDEFGEHLPNAEANARLISAAPELLEALTELVLYHDVPAEAQDPVVLPLLKAAFSAIAKAEGRQ